MKLVLQIAGGIFLAVVVILAVRDLPHAIEEHRQPQASALLENLAVDQVIMQCGKPVKDESDGSDRELFYDGPLGPLDLSSIRNMVGGCHGCGMLTSDMSSTYRRLKSTTSHVLRRQADDQGDCSAAYVSNSRLKVHQL